MRISIIAAIGENRELGKNNKLLWHIAEDLKRFKKITEGCVVIMGRKTFESIGKPLPNRLNIIITRDKNYQPRYSVTLDSSIKVAVVHSLKKAINYAECHMLRVACSEIFIIGGGQIYEQAMRYADRLYLTIIKGQYKADVFFPDYSDFDKIISEEKGESQGYKYKFITYEKSKR